MPVAKSFWFGHLSPTEFKEFTSELLGAMGSFNLDWRKGTPKPSSPADSGRDTEGDVFKVDLDKSQHVEHWFVDCKHYDKGVPADALENLVAWSNAGRPHVALLVVSGCLAISREMA